MVVSMAYNPYHGRVNEGYIPVYNVPRGTESKIARPCVAETDIPVVLTYSALEYGFLVRAFAVNKKRLEFVTSCRNVAQLVKCDMIGWIR
jgi:hypothetical protein